MIVTSPLRFCRDRLFPLSHFTSVILLPLPAVPLPCPPPHARTHARRTHAQERKRSHLPLPAVSLFSANVAKCLHFCITATIKPPPRCGLVSTAPCSFLPSSVHLFMKLVSTSRKATFLLSCCSLSSLLLISCPSLFLSLCEPPPLLLFHPSVLRASSPVPSAPSCPLSGSDFIFIHCSCACVCFSCSFGLQVSVPPLLYLLRSTLLAC